jgi:hypothetical protein
VRALLAAVACVAASVVLAACGDDAKTGSGEGADPSGTSTVVSTAAAAPPAATTTSPATTPTTTAPTATTGVPEGGVTQTSTAESGEGGAGDEEPARVPVALTARAGALSPSIVTVPAFLALDVRVTGAATTVTLPGGATLAAPGQKTLPGLKPGAYAITSAAGGRTTLNVVNGGDPGP